MHRKGFIKTTVIKLIFRHFLLLSHIRSRLHLYSKLSASLFCRTKKDALAVGCCGPDL